MAVFIGNGFWVVLPYDIVKDLPGLYPSPLGCKEERCRRPRLVCDHTFFGLNQCTYLRTPEEAMQFGDALGRILYLVRHAHPSWGPILLSKYDIKDGFYRMFLSADDCPRLAVTLPHYEGEEPLVAIPLVCTMGWAESPPTFCAMSETVCDLANAMAGQPTAAPHRLEHHCEPQDLWNQDPTSPAEELHLSHASHDTDLQRRYPFRRELPDSLHQDLDHVPSAIRQRFQPSLPTIIEAEESLPEEQLSTPLGSPPDPRLPQMPPPLPQPPNEPSNKALDEAVRHVDVFVDDFIGVAQGSRQHVRNLRRNILHAIDMVLDKPLPGETLRNEAASIKKLLQGDGSWNTRKIILGWVIDTLKGTLELPAHRVQRLQEIFDSLRDKRRISVKKWQKVIGELRFMSIGIPGSAGLFGALQLGLTESGDGRIRVTKHIRAHLNDFERLARDLCTRPTRIAEIVPEEPTIIRADDAAKMGMGGVIFADGHHPIVWRAPFPPEIQSRVVAADNPNGDLTNSDLEQAAMLAGADVATEHYDLRERTTASLSDNTPAISRRRKGTVSADSPGAYLCRASSLHQRHYRYLEEVSHIHGPSNAMADDASRLQHLSPQDLLTHFNSSYPQPLSWRFCQPTSELMHVVLSSLSKRTVNGESWLRPGTPAVRPSKFGPISSAPTARWTSPSVTSPLTTTSSSSRSSAKSTGPEKFPKAVGPSGLAPWRLPFPTLQRSSPTWMHPILDTETGAYSLPSRSG